MITDAYRRKSCRLIHLPKLDLVPFEVGFVLGFGRLLICQVEPLRVVDHLFVEVFTRPLLDVVYLSVGFC